METFLKSFNISVSPWLFVPAAYFLWVTSLLLVKKVAFRTLKKFAAKTKSQVDDIFIRAADFPLTLIIFTSGCAVIEWMLPVLLNAPLTTYFIVVFKATAIVAIVLFIDRLTNELVHYYADKVAILRATGGVAHIFIRVIVIGLGFLILMDSFGISITPLLASLGIGSLAVALAIQPTLENLFAGIQLVADKPIQVGHFIKLESGEEGYVHKIG